jgi:hypothetical protein
VPLLLTPPFAKESPAFELACGAELCDRLAIRGALRGGASAQVGVAQLVEHRFCKPKVRGSSPLASSVRASSVGPSVTVGRASVPGLGGARNFPLEGCPSGQREQAVNLPASAYVGSNPSPSTNFAQSSSSGLSLGGSLSRGSSSGGLSARKFSLRKSSARSWSEARRDSIHGGSLRMVPRTSEAWSKSALVPTDALRPSCGSSSVGRASAFQAECRGFESHLPLRGRRDSNPGDAPTAPVTRPARVRAELGHESHRTLSRLTLRAFRKRVGLAPTTRAPTTI